MTCHIKSRHPAFTFRHLWITLFLLCLSLGSEILADGGGDAIIRVSDLSKDASDARRQGLVILIEFASDSCEYCRLLEENFLIPMTKSQEYHNKVIIRSVPLDGDQRFTAFNGELVSSSQFASRYGVKVTPTMVFLDADGNELSDKLVGIWSLDYFGGFIDERIDTARAKVF
jgi:thioredoxin-related protein